MCGGRGLKLVARRLVTMHRGGGAGLSAGLAARPDIYRRKQRVSSKTPHNMTQRGLRE